MTNAARIAQALAGRKVAARGCNYLVPCPAHRDDTPSLSLKDGDRGNIVVHCFAGCDARDVFAAIRRKHSRLLDVGQAPMLAPVRNSTEYERRQHEKASWLWSRRQSIGGTIAEKYLRDVRAYSAALPLPPTLAFLPPTKPEYHPALIAAFSALEEFQAGELAPPRNVNSVQLVLLKSDGSGKADVQPNKLIIGSPCTNPIVLAPVNDLLALALCEGIEDALTAHAATGLGAWATGGGGRLPALADMVPFYVETATIYMHADKAGKAGALGLAEALTSRGVEVFIEGAP
jgi:hypothetical protein